MPEKEYDRILSRNFLKPCIYAMSAIFAAAFLCIFFNSAVSMAANVSVRTSPILLFSGALIMLAALAAFYIFTENKCTKNRTFAQKAPAYIFAFCQILMLARQIYLTVTLDYKPMSDSLFVDTAAKNFALGGSFADLTNGLNGHAYYYDRFPNNWGILIFLSFAYRILYLTFGEIPEYTPQVISIICIQLSMLVLYKISGLIFNDAPQRIFSAVFASTLPVFALYSQIFYTDVLSMPFVILSICFFIKAIKSEKTSGFALNTISSSVFLGIGYTIKGSAAVILAAVIIYALLKIKLPKAACTAAAACAAVYILNLLVFNTGLALGVSDRERLEQQRVPMIHWVMMSFVGNGGFNAGEYRYTVKHKGIENKKLADLERLDELIGETDGGEFLAHLTEKSMFTWNSGKYYAVHHFSATESSRVLWVIKSSRAYRIYCDGIHLVMLLLMLISAAGGLFRGRADDMFFIRLTVFGLALFLLIWETRSRYLVNFVPLFVLMSADGMGYLYSLCRKFFK